MRITIFTQLLFIKQDSVSASVMSGGFLTCATKMEEVSAFLTIPCRKLSKFCFIFRDKIHFLINYHWKTQSEMLITNSPNLLNFLQGVLTLQL